MKYLHWFAVVVAVPLASARAGNIDRMLADAHRSAGVAASERCDDATFIRRVSLDLLGRVPTEGDLQSFLAQPDRAAVVDRLLASPEHAAFWSQLWTSLLIGRGEQPNVEREVLRAWLEESLEGKVPLNQIAFQLIAAEGVTSLDGPANYVVASRGDPVMRLSRTFLSVQLDCAQCHDHPHDRWTNEDYVAMTRFYELTRFREVSGGVAIRDEGPDEKATRPRFLTGRSPHTSAWRRELAMMVVTSKPFSRAMVNRTWYWLMGRGIIDPVDGLSRDNPAVLPELLEQLAASFRSDGYRLSPLIRQICLSDAYQRKPATDSDSGTAEEQRRLFAARTIRMMLPEQWIASVELVLDRPPLSAAAVARRARQFVAAGRQATPASDPYHWTATSQTLVRQLSLEIPAPLRDIDSLFLMTVARRPTPRERQLVNQHSSQATLFALVHGNEFMMND